MNNEAITETENRADILANLKNMDEADLHHAWDIRCNILQYMDDYIFDMDDFDEIMNMYEWKPMEIAFSTFYGGFHPHDDFFKFNGYGNIESHRLLTHWIDMDELAREITESNELADALVNAGLLEEWRNADE